MFTEVSKGAEAPEYEVSTSIPRPAPITLSAFFGRIALVAILVGVAVFVILFGGNDVRELQTLASHGSRTAGHVYDKRSYSGKQRSYYLYYTLDVGRYHGQDRASVNSSTYDSTNVGGTLTVTYMPANPAIHRYGVVTDETAHRALVTWTVLGLLFTAMMGFILWLLESQIRLEQRLIRVGTCTKAQIFSNTPPTRGSRSNQCKVVYRFETDDGRVIQKTQKVSFRRGRQFIPGDAYTALYLPTNPKKVALLGSISMVRLPFVSRLVG